MSLGHPSPRTGTNANDTPARLPAQATAAPGTAPSPAGGGYPRLSVCANCRFAAWHGKPVKVGGTGVRDGLCQHPMATNTPIVRRIMSREQMCGFLMCNYKEATA
jgi:hypothetical protein